jgi:hypothetical protein
MERDPRLGNAAKQVAIASGEMYPAIQISNKLSWTSFVQPNTNSGNAGNGMLPRQKDRRRGAHLPKNVSGSFVISIWVDPR